MRRRGFIVTEEWLRENPNHIFVFGDNLDRKGKGGGAKLRDVPNTYGFITKKHPNNNDKSFYDRTEYVHVLQSELKKLLYHMEDNLDKTYMISQLGNGLANKYDIFPLIDVAFKHLERQQPTRVVLLW